MGDQTTYVYDAMGNPTEVFSPDAIAKAAANPNGTPTYNFYTEDNLLQATLIPVNSTDTQRGVCYAYDQSGRKIGQGNVLNTGALMTTVPSACVGGLPSASFGFTNLPDGRLAKETGRNGTSTLSFTYDADGNQLTSTDSTDSVTTTDTYYADDLLRTGQDMTSNYRTTDYAYDGAGNVTGRNSVPSSGLTYTDTIAYNDADLQATERTNLSAGTTTWAYDAGGRLTELQDGGSDYAEYSYASDGTMDGEAAYDSGGVYGSFFAQTLDGDYHVTSDGCSFCSTATGGEISHTFTYQYDAAGRLIFINATGGYPAFQTYDQDGNRITHDDVTTDAYTNYTYNADNSIATTILSGTPVAATYDTYGAGVMTSDGCAKWGLDTFDRATSYGQVASSPSVCPTVTSATYTHDANGTMITSTSGGTTTTLHDDPSTSTPIVENVGSTPTAYVLDSNGTPLEAAQGSTAAYLVDDPKGDLSTVMEPGSIIYPTCQLQYDPYGTAVFTTSPTNLCETGSTFVDLLYQNGRRDSSSGTYQMGSRTYDPSKNSFLSPDHYQLGTPAQDLSIGTDPLTENAYTFVDGDPVNQFDPTGHMFTTGCEDDPSGCTQSQSQCDTCRVYPTSGNHGSGPGGCRDCGSPGLPTPKPDQHSTTSGAFGFTSAQIKFLSSKTFRAEFLSDEEYACQYEQEADACFLADSSGHIGEQLQQCVLNFGSNCDPTSPLGNLGIVFYSGGVLLQTFPPAEGGTELEDTGSKLSGLGDKLGTLSTLLGGGIVGYYDYIDHANIQNGALRVAHAAIVGAGTVASALLGGWAGAAGCAAFVATEPAVPACAGGLAAIAGAGGQKFFEWLLDGDKPTEQQVACETVFGPNC